MAVSELRGERGQIILLRRYLNAINARLLPLGGGVTSRDGKLHVSWWNDEICVIDESGARTRRAEFSVKSVQQFIDVLSALNILPPSFSSAYQHGRDDARRSLTDRLRQARCA